MKIKFTAFSLYCRLSNISIKYQRELHSSNPR